MRVLADSHSYLYFSTMSFCFSCYTQQHKTPLRKPTEAEIDDALNKLGMLSTVTNSRQQYLEEKKVAVTLGDSLSSEKSEFKAAQPLCVLQNIVTNFTFSDTDLLSSKGDPDSETAETTSQLLKSTKLNQKSPLYRAKRRLLRVKPYNVPIKPRIKLAAEDMGPTLYDSLDTSGKPLITNQISRQDSGNKSNPSSPVKSQNSISSSGCSIVRSRSLDDLEISNLSLADCGSNEAGKADIDTVSQRISNLHVN